MASFLISSMSPKMLGSTAFAHDHSQGQSKLDPEAHKCVFVRDLPTKEG